jgi:predicted signal transduction protein with EAL and GGDEF domain
MSIYRQVWLAAIASMALALGGALLASMLGARDYMGSQLTLKNHDNAVALALMLSLEEPDQVKTTLLVASLFDSGHYEEIRILDPQGATLIQRKSAPAASQAPAWFVDLLPITAASGQAKITSGWAEVGSVLLRSDSRFAHQALWDTAVQTALAAAAATLLSGILATLVLGRLRKPLLAVTQQVQALSERRFITMALPNVPELQPLVLAMNSMVERLKAMLETEAARLERLRQADRTDAVTGLLSRTAFLQALHQALDTPGSGTGFIVIIRLANLAAMNRLLGREPTDRYLQAVGRALDSVEQTLEQTACGRLNGSDFALLLPAQALPEAQAQQCLRALQSVRKQHWPGGDNTAWLGWCRFQAGETLDAVLARVDMALAAAEADLVDGVRQAEHARHIRLPRSTTQWQAFIEQAIAQNSLRLAFSPVNSLDGQVLMQEATLMLPTVRGDGPGQASWLNAGQFMPVAQRLLRSAELDLASLQIALKTLATHPEWPALALPLSAVSIASSGFVESVVAQLDAHRAVTPRLIFQVSASGAVANLEALTIFCRAVYPRQCRMGISQYGSRFSEVTPLSELGISYLQLDARMFIDLAPQSASTDYVRGLCTLAHNLGWQVLAHDVDTREQLVSLGELGCDGASGQAWALPA